MRLVKSSYAVSLICVLAACGAKKEEKSANEASVEIYSWWTAGGEQAGLAGLINTNKTAYPNVTLINATESDGKAGFDFVKKLEDRLTGADDRGPPDSFQQQWNAPLRARAASGKIVAIDDVWAQLDPNNFHAAVVANISYEGKIYGVPTNIHRDNLFWYNKKSFSDLGIDAAGIQTMDDLWAAAEKVKAAGYAAFAINEPGWVREFSFLDCFLPSAMGVDAWIDMQDPAKVTSASWNSTGVRNALQLLTKYISYGNTNYKDTTFMTNYDANGKPLASPVSTKNDWDKSIELITRNTGAGDDRVAMLHMGTWGKGQLSFLGKVADVDYGWFTCPGTQTLFEGHSDTFVLPLNAPHPVNAKNWLAVVGSREAQDAMNSAFGATPARVDADPSKYDAYGKSALLDLKNLPKFHSEPNNSLPPDFRGGITPIVKTYLDSPMAASDADTAAKALGDLCLSSHFCAN